MRKFFLFWEKKRKFRKGLECLENWGLKEVVGYGASRCSRRVEAIFGIWRKIFKLGQNVANFGG